MPWGEQGVLGVEFIADTRVPRTMSEFEKIIKNIGIKRINKSNVENVEIVRGECLL